MSLIDGVSERDAQPASFLRWRRTIARALLDRFSAAYPQIVFDLFWDSPSINGHAWQIHSERHVSLYGGLVRHRALRWQGLALAIAHETGHHLGGKPRDPEQKLIAWQGQADYWAASIGMPKIFGNRAMTVTLEGARQFLSFHGDISRRLGDEPDLSVACRLEIFRAGARGLAIPSCAKVEYRRSFSCDYPEDNLVVTGGSHGLSDQDKGHEEAGRALQRRV